jgi:hypothetical protein
MSAFCILYSTANGVGEVKISVGLLLIRFALIKAIDCHRLKSLVIRISLHEKRTFIETPELGVNSYVVKPFKLENSSEALSRPSVYWLLFSDPFAT